MKNQTKTLNALLLGAITLSVACSSGTSTTSNNADSNSVQIIQDESNELTPDQTEEGVITIESSALFQELKDDLATAVEKYEKQKLLIKNVVVAGGYVRTDEVVSRRIYCIPLSSDLTKMGYLHHEFGLKIDKLKTPQIEAAWRPHGVGGHAMYGKTLYYLGNNPLNTLYKEQEETNYILIEVALEDPQQYKSLNLPKMYSVNEVVDMENTKPNYILNFTEVVDLECTISALSGGQREGAGVFGFQGVIKNKRSFPTDQITTIAKKLSESIGSGIAKKENDRANREIAGEWVGKVGSKNVIFYLNADGENEFEGDFMYGGNSLALEGQKTATANGWNINFTTNDDNINGEMIYDYTKSNREMIIKIGSTQGKLIKQ